MKTYTVRTDAFLCDNFEAENLDAAVSEAFDGEMKGVVDVDSLNKVFAKFVDDGGFCWVEEDGVRVVEIGSC